MDDGPFMELEKHGVMYIRAGQYIHLLPEDNPPVIVFLLEVF